MHTIKVQNVYSVPHEENAKGNPCKYNWGSCSRKPERKRLIGNLRVGEGIMMKLILV
jgi:hypothetical protein